MRTLAIACGLLLAACSTTPASSARIPLPQARVAYGDLNLESRTGQDLLVQRVSRSAEAYCARHSAIVTPPAFRNEPRHCLMSIRVQLVWAMPAQVRRAYDRGWARTDRIVRRPADWRAGQTNFGSEGID